MLWSSLFVLASWQVVALQEPHLVAHDLSETGDFEEGAMLQVSFGQGSSFMRMPTDEEIVAEEVEERHSMLQMPPLPTDPQTPQTTNVEVVIDGSSVMQPSQP